MSNTDLTKLRSPHFSIAELCASDTAKVKRIDNTPSEEVVSNLMALIWNVLEPARVQLGCPIIVTSGYRSPELNKEIGGVSNSQHQYGQAADLVCTNREDKLRLFDILKRMDIDQLLFEKNSKGTQWIHVSFKTDGTNRNYVCSNYKA